MKKKKKSRTKTFTCILWWQLNWAIRFIWSDPSPIVQFWWKAAGSVVYFDWTLPSFSGWCMLSLSLYTALSSSLPLRSIHPRQHAATWKLEFLLRKTHLMTVTSHYLVKQQPLWMTSVGSDKTNCTVKPGMCISKSCQSASCNTEAETNSVQHPIL